MLARSIRGAITVAANTEEEILEATKELLQALVAINEVVVTDIVNVLFTVTEDLDAQFPAVAARRMGWDLVPMLCSYEIAVPQSMKKCIRVLVTFNTEKAQHEIKHQYLREAVRLRPDLAGK